MTRAAEWFWIVALFLFLNLTFASTQPAAPQEGKGGEGQIYHDLAGSLPRQLPPRGNAPFVYQFGTPLVASVIAKSQDWVISAGFDRLNILFNLIAVICFGWVLQRHVPDLFARFLVLAAFMLEPHSPVRLSYFHPLSVESGAMAFLMAGLAGIDWFHEHPSPRQAALLAALVAVGVLFHPLVLIVGVAALFFPPSAGSGLRARWATLEKTGAWLPLVAGIATWGAVWLWVDASLTAFDVAGERARGNSPLQYVVAWFLLFGPWLALPLFHWRRLVSALRASPACAVWIVVLAFLASAGGTERFLVFASPVVWLLIARSMTWMRIAPAGLAMAALVLAEAVSLRVFAPIGGPIDPPAAGTEIWERLGSANVKWMLSDANMWSQTCAPSMLIFYAVWYALTAAMVIALLRKSERAPE